MSERIKKKQENKEKKVRNPKPEKKEILKKKDRKK